MSRKIGMYLIAGAALGLGGTAAAQTGALGSSELDLTRAYSAELRADTARHTSNLSNGRSGFTIASSDGVGSLNVGGLLQFRYTASFRDDNALDYGSLSNGATIVRSAAAGTAPGVVNGVGFVPSSGRIGAAVDLVTAQSGRLLTTSPVSGAIYATLADTTNDGVFNPTSLFLPGAVEGPFGQPTAGDPFNEPGLVGLANQGGGGAPLIVSAADYTTLTGLTAGTITAGQLGPNGGLQTFALGGSGVRIPLDGLVDIGNGLGLVIVPDLASVDTQDTFDLDNDGNTVEANGVPDITEGVSQQTAAQVLAGVNGAGIAFGILDRAGLNTTIAAGNVVFPAVILNTDLTNDNGITNGTTFGGLTDAQRGAITTAIQQSYILDLQRDLANGRLAQRIDDNDFTHGFNVQRARLDFYGNIAIPNLTYRISGDFGDAVQGGAGGDFNLTWAYAQYNFEGGLEGLYARVGIFKSPLFYEELVDPEYQLLAERSVVNEFFSQQYSEGVMLGYEADAFRVNLAFTDGLATRGTQFNSAGFFASGAGSESDVGITARADVKFAGDWAQFEDFTSWRGSDFAARVGAAIHWETYGDTNPDNVGSSAASLPTLYRALLIPGDASGRVVDSGDIISYTADGQLEGNGWNVFAAFYGRYEEADTATQAGGIIRDLLGIEEDVNDFGVVVQAGYLVTDQVELFARYEGLFLDDDRFGILADSLAIEEDLHFLTVGGNYYFIPESHALKFTADVIISFENTNALSVIPNGGGRTVTGGSNGPTVTGLLGQSDDTEVVLRGQFQLLF